MRSILYWLKAASSASGAATGRGKTRSDDTAIRDHIPASAKFPRSRDVAHRHAKGGRVGPGAVASASRVISASNGSKGFRNP